MAKKLPAEARSRRNKKASPGQIISLGKAFYLAYLFCLQNPAELIANGGVAWYVKRSAPAGCFAAAAISAGFLNSQ
jgi:hypothetical protein